MLVYNDWLIPKNTLKIQSSPLGNIWDFHQGDEMNMHIPQSLQTFTELMKICLVPYHIISPGSCKNIISIVQDTLIGGYLLTIQDVKLRKEQVYNLMMFSKDYNGNLPEPTGYEFDVPYWSGKQLFSLIIPDISMTQLKNIKIVRGSITEGYLDKDSLGESNAGIVKQVYNAYGMEKCNDFLNYTQQLITRWFAGNSYSISYGDCVIKPDQRKFVNDTLKSYIEKCYELIRTAQNGLYALDLDDVLKSAKIDVDIQNILSEAEGKVRSYLTETVSKKNSIYMATVGAQIKGSSQNILQIMGMYGQNMIWGSRVDDSFTERTLPHFGKNDIGPSSRGFCASSLIEGMSPSEMYFNAIAGRTSVIDTAINTADTGYVSRRFIKAAEDLKVNYDFTVRNSSNFIVQFAYGDDNMDPTKLERLGKIELFDYNNEKMKDTYLFEQMDNTSYFETFMTPKAVEEMMNDKDYKTILKDDFDQLWNYRDELRYKIFKNAEVEGDVGTFIPINLYRVIPSLLIKFKIEPYHLCDMTPRYIMSKYNEIMDSLTRFFPEKNYNWLLFRIIFRSFISCKRIMKEYRMNKLAFDFMIQHLKEKIMGALISPGELVGIIGAQTLGEYSTQLTLNTHHAAGVGAGALVITQGMPRLKEIINLTKNLKVTNMTIYLKTGTNQDKDKAKAVQARFKYTQIKDVLDRVEIIYDNPEGNTDMDEDLEFMKSYKEFADLFQVDNSDEVEYSPWILRLLFNKESLMNRKISMQEIQETIKMSAHDDSDIDCVYSDDSANDVVMRIKIKHDGKTGFLESMKDFEKQLVQLPLRGISNIEEVSLKEGNIMRFDEDGSIRKSKEQVLETQGSNLLDVLADDDVDNTRTITTDILEFHELFGIEATRELIYRELCKVYKDNSNPRHMQMLSEIMTYRGRLMKIDRHGLNKNPEVGPIGKASFEEVMNIFTKAALFAEKDNMKGVSANILAGQFCKAGTNNFEILIDEEKLINMVKFESSTVDTYEPTEEEVNNIFNKTYGKKTAREEVKDEDFEFGFGMEKESEHVLTATTLGNISVKTTNNKTKKTIPVTQEDLEELVMEEPEYVVKNVEETTMEEPTYEAFNDKPVENMVMEEPSYQNESLEEVVLESPLYKEDQDEKPLKTVRKSKTTTRKKKT